MVSTRFFATTALLAAAAAAPTALALDQPLYGINYDLRRGADWDANKCKTPAMVSADMKILKTITTNVRTYALADCDVAPVLKAAKASGLTVWLGVWVSADSSVYDSEVAALKKLIQAGLIDSNVVGFNVGSEAVYRKDITAEKAIEYLKDFKAVLTKNEITAPVAITDIVDVLTAYPDMVAAGDVVTANQFPFWEKIEASKAVAQFNTRIQPLLKLANGKEVIISETGWPSGGTNVNASEASPEGAARYLNDFVVLATEQKWKYYYFAGFDSPYKAEQAQEPETVESYFGIFSSEGKMKSAFADLKIKKNADSSTTTTAGGSSSKNSTATSGTDESTATTTTTTDASEDAAPTSSTNRTTNSNNSTTSGGKNNNAAGGAAAGTVHAGDSTSTNTDGVSKDTTSSSNGASSNTNNKANAAAPSTLASAGLAACLAIASTVLLSL